MNVAMRLYSTEYQGNKSENKIGEFLEVCSRQPFKKDCINKHGHREFTFVDGSQIIFTSDNVQVSLF